MFPSIQLNFSPYHAAQLSGLKTAVRDSIPYRAMGQIVGNSGFGRSKPTSDRMSRCQAGFCPATSGAGHTESGQEVHRVDSEGGMAGVDEGVLLDLDDYAGHEQCDAALFHHPLVADVSACRTGGL